MKPEYYKKQFLAFLAVAFPDGLPPDTNALDLNCNGKQISFVYDPTDYAEYVKVSSDKKTAAPAPRRKEFKELLTYQDIEWLKNLRVSISDIEKQSS
jgi:hypothetical protein